LGGHVAPLGHIILIQSQPVFVLTPESYGLIGDATNTNILMFGLTQIMAQSPDISHSTGKP